MDHDGHQHDEHEEHEERGHRDTADRPSVLPDPAGVEVHPPLDAGTGPNEAELDPARSSDDEDDDERFDAG